MKQRIIESMNQRFDESTNQWMNERMNGSSDGRMSELLSLLSYFFTERPLRWGTSSLSYLATSSLSSLLSGPLLLWTAAHGYFVAQSTYRSSLRAAVSIPPCNSQSRLPGASQHHKCFSARSPANALCHSRFKTPKSTNLGAVSTLYTLFRPTLRTSVL